MRIRISAVAALAVVGAALTMTAAAQQQKPWEKIPIHKLHEFKPQQPKRIELSNGIVLFLQEDHELPFVNGTVLIPGGSTNEDAAKAGLVSLYGEAWRTSGTAKLDGDAMDDLLEAKAAHVETDGGAESTEVSWDSLKADSDQVFDLAMDLLFHPKFTKEKLNLAKQQMAAGIVRRNDEAGGIARREARKLAYGVDSPYTHQTEFKTIIPISVDDLNKWHDATIDGKLIVGVSGDFDSAAMEAKLRAVFEKLPAAKPYTRAMATFKDPAPAVYFINKEDVNQSNIYIVGLGTDRHNPEIPAISLANEIIGGGAFSARLFQKVRTELGLAYGVGGGVGYDFDHTGITAFESSTKSESTVEATKAILAEISDLKSKPITQAELDRAKDNILNSFLFLYDSPEKVLGERVRLEFYGYPADYLESYRKGIEGATVAQVNHAALAYIHPEKMAVLVVGKGSDIKPGLDELKMGEVKSIDITIPMPGGAQ